MRLLDRTPQVEKTSVFGTSVHAVLQGDAREVMGRLRRQLEAAGLVVISMAVVPPSLEDVFLEVIEQREKVQGG
jgi:hypothetical protein